MDTLYYQSYDGVLLMCLGSKEASETLEEMNGGICGAHQSGPKLYDRVCHQGYYRPTMISDALEFSKSVKIAKNMQTI